MANYFLSLKLVIIQIFSCSMLRLYKLNTSLISIDKVSVMKGIPLQGQTKNEQDTVSDNLMRGKHVAVSKDSNRSTRAKRESVWLKDYVAVQ